MKRFLVEIGLAIVLGAALLFAYFAQNLLSTFPAWNKTLSALVICCRPKQAVCDTGNNTPRGKVDAVRLEVLQRRANGKRPRIHRTRMN